MNIKVDNIIMPLDHSLDEVFQEAAKKAFIKEVNILERKILRRSVDARKNHVLINYAVFFKLRKKIKPNKFAKEVAEEERLKFKPCEWSFRPYIIGMGPAGLFAAYYLAKCGLCPIVIERGTDVYKRKATVEDFAKGGELDTECNIQFGEGGAGTFSDGKLTTRINDKICNFVLDIFHAHGAPEEILYYAKPHIGTDVLIDVIASMRREIINLGGEIRFNSHLDDVKIKNGKLEEIVVNGIAHECKCLILAIGHSARDTYEMLFKKGVHLTAKPFAIGVRIEHLQEFIDVAQYGKLAGHKNLGAADYRLTYNGDARNCFSFCMCPGGTVVAAASEEYGVVVNGMSNHARDGKNANSALIVNVTEKDFDGVLGGIEFQRRYERSTFNFGGEYFAPVQQTVDFLDGKVSSSFADVAPTYPRGTVFADLSACLPPFVAQTLQDGIRSFDRKIEGFIDNSILTGVETRTSAPVRILRDSNMESVNVKGLYPIGEGAGYAGGIMSSAVDGIKASIKLTNTL